MRGRFAWLLAGLGIAAAIVARLYRKAAQPTLPGPSPSTRADELRQRIAEARELVGERDEFEAAETPVDEADPESRRRDVHQRGRAAVDRMRGNGDSG